MKITLKKLSLLNFKGIKKYETEFSDITNVFGDNATGKTTLFDAFTWLFWGKDSSDKKDFNVKTIKSDGTTVEKVEHEVSAEIMVGEDKVTLRRVLKEKWVKKRGEQFEEFTGHETLLFWNEVPMSLTEYNVKVNQMLNENLFKLITNAHYFNTMKWQDRRKVLFEIAGEISDSLIFDKITTVSNKHLYDNLINVLNSGKTLDEYKKELSAKKKRIKDELESIPHRTDEIQRNMPEAVNESEVNAKIDLLNKEIADIDAQLESVQEQANKAFEAVKNIQSEIHSLEKENLEIKHQLDSEESQRINNIKITNDAIQGNVQSISSQLSAKKSELQRFEALQKSLNDKSTLLNNEMNSLREKWGAENAREIQFNENEFCCPTCKRDFDASDVESKKAEMVDNFNNNKLKNLDAINSEGITAKNEYESIQTQIESNTKVIGDLSAEVTELEQKLTDENAKVAQSLQPIERIDINSVLELHPGYQANLAKIAELKNKISLGAATADTTALKSKKIELGYEIQQLQKSLTINEVIASNKKRLAELENQQSSLGLELANLEGYEYSIDEFNKAKIDQIESIINSKFSFVRFKMFNTLINGGTEECCETLVNGVPYSDINNAAKINAGLDIINTLCKHYNVTAPCFIDNAESVTKLTPIESQLIRLIVSEPDKQLRIRYGNELAEAIASLDDEIQQFILHGKQAPEAQQQLELKQEEQN